MVDITEEKSFEDWQTTDLEQTIMECSNVSEVLTMVQGYMTPAQYREFLIEICNGLAI